jgi:putative DNA methylase
VDEVSIVSETSLPIDWPRLIERAFPLKQASLDSVHEKNVRHGHISTLHIWPARRPLAACRAALIATLLPDPGTPEERRRLCEKIAGKVVEKIEKKKMPNGRTVERIKEETKGGILHWLGSEPTSGGKKKQGEYRRKAKFYAEELEWFRQEIRKAYGGRAPRVLDPFAGGGAIPLEAMRLGCEVTAVDINPVAWFILKCTLEYPQKLARKTPPLPNFILDNGEFMAAFYKARPDVAFKAKRSDKTEGTRGLFEQEGLPAPAADLAWHVRAWGNWVLDRARRELAKYYPTYTDFEPLKPGKAYEKQPMRLVPLKDDGRPDVDSLNAEFSEEYLVDPRNPRWVAKPTVAYLWARTVTCKNCRAQIPLLKTRWMSKKDGKRVLLTTKPNPDMTGVVFGVETDIPVEGGNAAQRREHDKRLGAGTMTRAGADCPCCGLKGIMTMEDIRVLGQAQELGIALTGVVVDGSREKEYRLPTLMEIKLASDAVAELDRVYSTLPFGMISEPLASKEALGFRVPLYGFDQWSKLFTPRQLLALGVLVNSTRKCREAMKAVSYSDEWAEAICAYLAVALDRTANYMSSLCIWENVAGEVKQTFLRFALPITWDFGEANPLSEADRYYNGAVSNVVRVLRSLLPAVRSVPAPSILIESAIARKDDQFDLIVTDPPYYDAIPYSDLMDFFYIWLRRTLSGVSTAYDHAFAEPLSPKWDHVTGDGELIDDSSRHDGDPALSKKTYEDGMARAFEACSASLIDSGRLVIVFAHKQPDAWETLVSAMIRAGFVVDGSWPIQTEMRGGVRNFGRASLASSVWLVCKKRPATARPGWDNKVLEEMRANIATRLREFWDAGIRGPDFVWAATGPALEAYSKHPVVRKANDPGKTMEVGEFLSHVRRMVVDFVVGQVLTGDSAGADLAAADRMDAPTAYYLLHRHDFGLEEAPSGACILYATACGLSDHELEAIWDILVRTGGSGGRQDEDEEDEDADPDAEVDPDSASDSGSRVKLKTWVQRQHRSMGYEAPGGQPVPLIDRVHRLMHLWRAGDVLKVEEYLDDHGLRRHELFKRLLQSLIELSPAGSDERSLLESLSNHVGAKGAKWEAPQVPLPLSAEE